MTPGSTAITGCYYSNGILFVVGTVSYSGSGRGQHPVGCQCL